MVPDMSIEAWTQSGWLREHPTQRAEIEHLVSVAEGDLASAADASADPELRFEYAYNAALKACLIALYAERRRPGRMPDVHHKIIRSLPLTLGGAREVEADYLDACRERRDRLGEIGRAGVGPEDAEALRLFAVELHADLAAWMQAQHPEFAAQADPE